MAIKENINPQKNPWTTVPGILFIILSFIMATIKYILPLFFTLKQDVAYGYVEMMIIGFIGLIMLFMSDELFKQIFSAVLNVFKKKTDTQ
jgi:hypothetical protein